MAKRELVLIGAGKIGRGYLADVFNRKGYKLIFLEYAEGLVNALKEQGYYTVFMSHDGAPDESFRIGGYDIYCTETEYETCVNVLANANYATVHVYPGACESIGHMIGDAIKKRVREGNKEPLDIFTCVNFQGPAKILKDFALERLTTQAEKDYIESNVGFVQTLIYRNGGIPTPEMLAEDPLCVSMSDTTNWPVDKDAFKGAPPEGIDNAVLTDHFEARLVYKVWAGNMVHCMSSYVGKQRGYEYYYQSGSDPYIYKCSALAKLEANHGICSEFNISVDVLDDRKKGKIAPFDPKAAEGDMDTLNRIGADPKRKLSRGDRFIGPALLCLKHGKTPYFLTRGAAMGFYFVNPEDASACEIQDYIKSFGIEKAVAKYCQLNLSDPLDKQIYELVLMHYYEIGDAFPEEITE